MGRVNVEGGTRRQALAAGIAGLAAALAPRAGAARQAMLFTGGGLAGGGRVKIGESGEAEVALFATRLVPEGREPIFLGRILWVDPGWAGRGVTLESLEISAYGPIQGFPTGRMARGTMSVDGAGSYPFELRAHDLGPPGSGQDTVTLTVGTDVSDFSYSAVGTLVVGDIELLTFNFSVPLG